MSREPRVPRDSAFFDNELRIYLLERDAPAPNVPPAPRGYAATLSGGVRLDELSWDYTPAAPPRALPPDGWAIFYAMSDTVDPIDGAFLLPLEQRSFVMVQPADQAASYAIAGFRNTYQGMILGPKLQPDIWRIAGGTSPGEPVPADAIHFEVDLLGVKDGVNTVFTSPFALRLTAEAVPMGTLFFKRGRQIFTDTAPPAQGRWSFVAPDEITLGEAPLAGDELRFSIAIAA